MNNRLFSTVVTVVLDLFKLIHMIWTISNEFWVGYSRTIKNHDFWVFSFKLKLHRTLQRHYSYSVIGNIKISWVEKLKFLLRHFARVENSFHLLLFSESTFALIQTCKLTFWKKESQKLELAVLRALNCKENGHCFTKWNFIFRRMGSTSLPKR